MTNAKKCVEKIDRLVAYMIVNYHVIQVRKTRLMKFTEIGTKLIYKILAQRRIITQNRVLGRGTG